MGTESDAEFVAFVEAVWQRYVRLARLLTGDRHRGEDLLQDCLVKLYERWRRVTQRGDPHAYLQRMLINGSVSRWRRGKREQLVAAPPETADLSGGPPDVRDDVRRALLALPRQQRAVIVLRHYEDLTERQVADVLGCSIGTVKSHNARALHRLRELLDLGCQDERMVKS